MDEEPLNPWMEMMPAAPGLKTRTLTLEGMHRGAPTRLTLKVKFPPDLLSDEEAASVFNALIRGSGNTLPTTDEVTQAVSWAVAVRFRQDELCLVLRGDLDLKIGTEGDVLFRARHHGAKS